MQPAALWQIHRRRLSLAGSFYRVALFLNATMQPVTSWDASFSSRPLNTVWLNPDGSHNWWLAFAQGAGGGWFDDCWPRLISGNWSGCQELTRH